MIDTPSKPEEWSCEKYNKSENYLYLWPRKRKSPGIPNAFWKRGFLLGKIFLLLGHFFLKQALFRSDF